MKFVEGAMPFCAWHAPASPNSCEAVESVGVDASAYGDATRRRKPKKKVDRKKPADAGFCKSLEAVADARLLHDVVGEVAVINLGWDNLVSFSISPNFVSALTSLR